MQSVSISRRSLSFLAAALVALGLLLPASSTSARSVNSGANQKITLQNLYQGLSGQHFIYNGEADSGTLTNGLMNNPLADWSKKTGATVSFDNFCCSTAKLQTMEQNNNVIWTVVQWAEVSDLKIAEKNHLLLKLDPKIIPLNLLKPKLHDAYGIFGYPYASLLAWNTNSLKSSKRPTGLEDIFDTKDFPGKRCLYKYPQFGGTLEAALLASGVSPNHLYPIDMHRALTELNTIRNDIVWWSTGSQGIQELASGACSLGIFWNGPLYDAVRTSHAPFRAAWGHNVIDYSTPSIPKGVKSLKAAEGILRTMIIDRPAQERFLKQTAYLLMPLKHQVPIPASVRPWVLAGPHAKTEILENDVYYANHIATLLKQFNDWVVSGQT